MKRSAAVESSVSPTPPAGMGRRLRLLGTPSYLLGLLPLAVGLALWQALVTEPSPYFPRPSLWFDAIVHLLTVGTLVPALWETVSAFFASFVIAILLGSTLGMLIGRSPLAFKTTGPLFEFCRALPAAAIVPLAVLFGGYTANMKIAVVVFAATWPILLTVQVSAATLPAARQDLGRSMRLNHWQSITRILIPSMIPAILRGIRVAAPIVLIIVLLVEIVTQIPGLGALLAAAQQSFRSAEVYGIVAIACILGVLTNGLVSLVESVALRYEQH